MRASSQLPDGQPLNSSSSLLLEGVLSVGYARVLELRKLNGKKLVPRLSVAAADAPRCSAVVLPLVRRGAIWVADRSRVKAVLAPLGSVGRRVVASPATGGAAGSLSIAPAASVAGGPALTQAALTAAMFGSAKMVAVTKDLMDMKVTELKEELKARGVTGSGNKAWLRRALHAAVVRESLGGS